MYVRIPTIDISNTVTRTVAMKILDDLKRNLSIDSSAFIALENVLEQKAFTSGVNASIDKNSLEMPIVESISAKIDNRKINDYTVSNPLNQSKPLFYNKHIAISTEFINYEMSITLTYNTKSKVNADELENYLSDHAVTRGNGYLHLVDYYYLVPDVILGLLEDIYTASKVNIPDNENFLDFLKTGNIMGAIVLTSDINGFNSDKVGLAAIATNQIHGVFDIGDIKDPVKEFDTGTYTWTVSTTYKINYLVPVSFIVDFALLVNNTMLDESYYIEKADHAIDPTRVKSVLYPESYNIIPNKQDYVFIPPYDNTRSKPIASTITNPIMSVLCCISLTDRRSLFNLTDLYYYQFNDDIIDYMKANYMAMVKPLGRGYDSLFVLDLYKDNALVSRSNLTIDADLNISAIDDLDLSSIYRVVLSVVVDLKLLSPTGTLSIKDLDLVDKLEPIITGKYKKDYRVADSNTVNYLLPVGTSSMKTAQVSLVKTLFKE